MYTYLVVYTSYNVYHDQYRPCIHSFLTEMNHGMPLSLDSNSDYSLVRRELELVLSKNVKSKKCDYYYISVNKLVSEIVAKEKSAGYQPKPTYNEQRYFIIGIPTFSMYNASIKT